MKAIKDLWNRSVWGKLALVVGALMLCNGVGSLLSGGGDEAQPVAEAPRAADEGGAVDGGDQAPSAVSEPTDRPAPTDPPAPTEPPTEAPPALPSFGDGTHLVGTDIQPGLYRNADVGAGCYWARLSGLGGGLEDIVTNDNASGSAIVEIGAGDTAFESTRCGTWVLTSERITESMTRFGEGAFLVGVDIEPGRYRSEGGTLCYWARLGNFGGAGVDGILANDNVEGQAIVDIAATDRGFTSTRCGGWVRVE